MNKKLKFFKDTLTNIIGIFIMYLELVTMLVDIIAMVVHQKIFKLCIEQIEKVDKQLQNCHIPIDYDYIMQLLLCLIIIVFGQVAGMAIVSLLTFEINSIWWYGIYLPLIVNTLAKMWFVAFVECIRLRFVAINSCLNDLRTLILNEKSTPITNKKLTKQKHKQLWRRGGEMHSDTDNIAHVVGNFSHPSRRGEYVSNHFVKKLIDAASERTKNKIHFIKPSNMEVEMDATENYRNYDDSGSLHSTLPMPSSSQPASSCPIVATVDDKFDSKLSTLCFLHDDICEIGKLINQMFNFQMLILMAYGFMSITAQLYFVYCGLVGQVSPNRIEQRNQSFS